MTDTSTAHAFGLAAWAIRKLEKAGIHIAFGDEVPRKWDLRVNDPQLFRDTLLRGSVGFGESYELGYFDCDDLAAFFERLFRAGGERLTSDRLAKLARTVVSALINLQNITRARASIHGHYDLSNDFFSLMLDPSMVYSCGYQGRGATTLENMQQDKLALVADKLALEAGMRVLDIGCGWGAMAAYLSHERGAQVRGITLAHEQAVYAKERYRGRERLGFFEHDYRDEYGRYDRVVSIGMFEHVGCKNYPTFFAKARELLPATGVFVLHSIVVNGREKGGANPWINRYIFPGGYIPAPAQILSAAAAHFACWDEHDFGPDYAVTLRYWRENFERNWQAIREVLLRTKTMPLEDLDRFRRRWRFYLASCEGAFAAGRLGLRQFVFSPQPKPEGYIPVR